MPLPYPTFSELVLHTIQGKDYRFRVLDRHADLTVATIQGGGIEPLTSELAEAISGEECNLYDFQGLRPTGNEALRVPPLGFEEMRLLMLMGRSRAALAVGGTAGEAPVVHLGGRNKPLRQRLEEYLRQAGLTVEGPAEGIPAHSPRIFFNLPPDGGVQMQLTHSLRELMVEGPLPSGLAQAPAQRTETFRAFVSVVRAALERYRAEMRGDPQRALDHFERITNIMPPNMRRRDHGHNGH